MTSTTTAGAAPLSRDEADFNEVDRDRHFAAREEPELFATEVRAAFRSVR